MTWSIRGSSGAVPFAATKMAMNANAWSDRSLSGHDGSSGNEGSGSRACRASPGVRRVYAVQEAVDHGLEFRRKDGCIGLADAS